MKIKNSQRVVIGADIRSGRDSWINSTQVNHNYFGIGQYQRVTEDITNRKKKISRIRKSLHILSQVEGEEAHKAELEEELAAEKENLEMLIKEESRLRDEIRRLEESLWRGANSINRNSERLKKVKKLMENGCFKEANELLSLDSLEEDKKRLLSEGQKAMERLHQVEEGQRHTADEYMVKAQITAINLKGSHKQQFEEIIALYEASIELDSNFHNNFNYAGFLYYCNKLRQARDRYIQAIDKAGGRADLEADALLNLGMIFQDLEQQAKAMEQYKKATALIRSLARPPSAEHQFKLARCLNAMAILQFELKNHTEAESNFREALNMLPTDDLNLGQASLANKASILNNLGKLNSHAEGFGQALKYYQQALSLYQELASTDEERYLPLQAFVLTNLGGLYHDVKREAAALQYYRKAEKIFSELAEQDPYTFNGELGWLYINIGGYYLEFEKNKGKSLDYARRGLELIRPLLRENPAWAIYEQAGVGIEQAWE